MRAEAEFPAHCLLQTPHASRFCSCCSRPLTQPAATPRLWRQHQGCSNIPVYPGGLCFTGLHKPLPRVKGTNITRHGQVSLTGNSHHRQGEMRVPSGHTSILWQHPSCPAQRRPLTGFSSSEPTRPLLIFLPGRAHRVIGETLLMMTYFIFYKNSLFSF